MTDKQQPDWNEVGPELLAVLEDWENTPGNHRDAKWWHNWEDSRRQAIAKAKGESLD